MNDVINLGVTAANGFRLLDMSYPPVSPLFLDF